MMESNMSGSEKKKQTIFISYSHLDEKWKDRLVKYLEALELKESIVIWHDRKIDFGETWYPEIKEAMDQAIVSICLISENYLGSPFIKKEEIPSLLERRKNAGMLLMPILISPCPWKTHRWIKDIQMFPRDGRCLEAIEKEVDLKQALSDIAEFVCDKINNVPIKIYVRPLIWLPLSQNYVSIERLPATGKEVFGRSKELELLDKAWESGTTHIISFVAWGGVGKSALVNKWVEYMQKDNFRGAKRVYAWSFYSQGTKQRITSADQFIDQALRRFGDSATADSEKSPWDKGKRLAELVQQEKTLLLLDGMEPLQSGFAIGRGEITDPALSVLIKQLSKKNPGLCVITTREEVKGFDAYKNFIEQKNLEQISAEAGRALLRVVGNIKGTDAELEEVTKKFGNHALAINLLTAYLQGQPASRANEIPDLPNISVEDGNHPRRVMEAFAKRFGKGPELDVLHLVGLFDRPMNADEILHLRKNCNIQGLTNRIYKMSEKEWKSVVEKLRLDRLIAPESHHNKGGLDAHPLVREHFGQQLQNQNPSAWKEAHSRLFEYYKGLPKKEFPDTLEEMMPLFLAVTHGCKAERHQEVETEVYWKRMTRQTKYYTNYKLGAFGADLACIAGFFDPPWSRVVDGLRESSKAYILSTAGFDLRALGRLDDALKPMKMAFDAYIVQRDWKNAATTATNQSEFSLTLGNMAQAVEYAKQSVKYADDGKDPWDRIVARTALADALVQEGKFANAGDLFLEAEKIQKEWKPQYTILCSLPGFQYCDLLLSQGKYQEVQGCATQTHKWSKDEGWGSLLTIANDLLSIGFAHLLAAIKEGAFDFKKAAKYLDLAVDGLRKAGHQDYLPRGIIDRAELYRNRNEFDKAREDLDEAFEIADRSGMRLYICDIHLECSRLIMAMHEAGKKLNANEIDPGSPLAIYDAANHPLEAARKHIDKAKELIGKTGYHRRDPEILLETARLEFIQGNKNAASIILDAAIKKIDEMGCHCWDIDVRNLQEKLA